MELISWLEICRKTLLCWLIPVVQRTLSSRLVRCIPFPLEITQCNAKLTINNSGYSLSERILQRVWSFSKYHVYDIHILWAWVQQHNQ